MNGFIFVEGGQNEHGYRFRAAGIELFGAEDAGGCDAIHYRHANIHHHDIGLKPCDQFNAGAAVTGFPDHHNVGL
jgi:hypothetical protein